MKRKRKVILIACSIALLLLFLLVAWAKTNGDFYAIDRSGMTLSLGETVRHLFSSDVENGVMFVAGEFPKRPDRTAGAQAIALQRLKRASITWRSIHWSKAEEAAAFGIFVNTEIGEVAIYSENEEFVFQLLEGSGIDMKIRYFPKNVLVPMTQVSVFPEGVNFGKWEIRKVEGFSELLYFSKTRILDFINSENDFAIFVTPRSHDSKSRIGKTLIFYDPSALTWQMRKWIPEWKLADWKTIIEDDSEYLLNN